MLDLFLEHTEGARDLFQRLHAIGEAVFDPILAPLDALEESLVAVRHHVRVGERDVGHAEAVAFRAGGAGLPRQVVAKAACI
nr:hypothetical protein [Sinirhodobacter populi]